MDLRRRGYVLMEVMMGGAMLAVLLTSVLMQLGEARGHTARAGRDAVSGRLVEAKLEELRDLGAAAASGSDAPVTQGTYARSWTVSGAQTQVVGDARTLTFRDVNVVVTYSFKGQARTSRAATRVYGP